ncbi:MAG: Gfo/Idh/MocA family oxidoreductase [Dermatophilaceae bacterium]
MTRVGLVGYGLAGAQFHAPLLRAAGLTVVAVATRNPERIAQVAADLPDALTVPDLDALLAVPRLDLDLVVVASPSGQHVENAQRVLDAGLAVVVDKPLAVDAASARALVDRAARQGTVLTVFHNRRYDPEYATLSKVVRSGVIGEVLRAELRWERWRPERRERWRETQPAEQGGGLLLDLFTHLVDQVMMLFGPITTVYAELAAHRTAAEDDAFLSLRHSSGVVSHLGASTVVGAPGPRMRVIGMAGSYILGSAGDEPTAFPDADGGAGQHGWVVRGADRDPVSAEHADPADFYRDVASALASPDPQAGMPVDPTDAVLALAVIDAARASARTSQVVTVSRPAW